MAFGVSDNIVGVNERIYKAARRAGRDPSEITLLAVTKTVEVKLVKEAFSEGIRVFGENYVQEAEEKVRKIKDPSVRWHFIGALQKNKINRALELFDVIETIDSSELAINVDKRATKPIDVFMEVNLAKEKTKGGVTIDGAVKLAGVISGLSNLRLKGLMCVPPLFDSPETSRPYFIMLRRLAERINKEKIPNVFVKDLSMGTSSDFEVAIEEGATVIRLGTAIFGQRDNRKSK